MTTPGFHTFLQGKYGNSRDASHYLRVHHVRESYTTCWIGKRFVFRTFCPSKNILLATGEFARCSAITTHEIRFITVTYMRRSYET